MFYVYFIKSIRNQKIYVGSTSKEPNIRLKEHNTASNQWTKNNGPFTLIYFETFHCQTCAKSRELFYKTGYGRFIKKAIVDSISSAQFRPEADQPMAEARALH